MTLKSAVIVRESISEEEEERDIRILIKNAEMYIALSRFKINFNCSFIIIIHQQLLINVKKKLA